MPAAPEKRAQVPLAQAVHGFGEPALKGISPLLAVGDHRQARALLELDGVRHGAVFDGLEPMARDALRGGRFPRRNEVGRSQQAADMVGMASDHGVVGRVMNGLLGLRRLSWMSLTVPDPDSALPRPGPYAAPPPCDARRSREYRAACANRPSEGPRPPRRSRIDRGGG